jgi:FlaG/FlaF family flagellin (archaellin)
MPLRTMKKPKMMAASPAAAVETMIAIAIVAATAVMSARLRRPSAARPPASTGGKL